jgi:hypothetical protein
LCFYKGCQEHKPQFTQLATYHEISKDEPSHDKPTPPQASSQTNPVSTIKAPTKKPDQPQKAKQTFSKVRSAEEWKSLLRYYIACLNYEYQKKLGFSEHALYPYDFKQETIYAFLSGKSHLKLRLGTEQNALKKFLDSSGKGNQQLCLGKSFIRFSDQVITPLLFVPVTMDRLDAEYVLLKAEELSLSYASLLKLGYDPEEVAGFLEAYQQFIVDQPPLKDIENFILKFLAEHIFPPTDQSTTDAPITAVPSSQLLDISGFFWADNRFTGNLINELGTLTNGIYWNNAPAIIKNLLNHLPEHEHQPAPDFIDDQNFYVTDINTQQRKSVRAVSEHPVTIITGPPGTGKSQLVLNLIAQAYLDGQSVLFASRNNKAVDVVMDRLQGEVRFQGAIRTGSQAHRQRAVGQMESALAQIERVDLRNLQSLYKNGKLQLKKADEDLKLVRDLQGKIRSYQSEKEEMLDKIPHAWKDQAASLDFPFIEHDKLRINEFLSLSLAQVRALIDQREKLIRELRAGLDEGGDEYPVLRIIAEYELKWGKFASGMLHKASFSSITAVNSYCLDWINLLETLTVKKAHLDAENDLKHTKSQIDQNTHMIGDEESEATLRLAELSPEDMTLKLNQVANLESDFDKIKAQDYSIFQKILMVLGLINPKKKLWLKLQSAREEAGLSFRISEVDAQEIDTLSQSFESFKLVIQTSALFQRMEALEESVSTLKMRLEELSTTLADDMVKSFDRLDLRDYTAEPLIIFIRQVQEKAAKCEQDFTQVLNTCHSFFVDNDESLDTVIAFQNLFNGHGENGIFGFDKSLTEDEAFDWATTFRRAIVIWETNAIIQHSWGQLSELPSEADALKTYQSASGQLFTAAGDLMRATWINRAAEMNNEVFGGTQKYVSAARQLNNTSYGENPKFYMALKDAKQDNFKFALQMFPIWAITNLTARTNFPLEAGLFDLLIIDEASQCDIPSVIPLLYRAKKVVVIGDPNQLRHVASLHEQLDKKIAGEYGVGLEAFSYISTSFYDLGERGVGLRPGPVLLNEHYRSDPRIITFSNQAFYNNQLVIKTDLTQRGFNKTFLNQRGGIHWLNTPGKFIRPPDGSGYNLEEFRQLQVLVPRILNALDGEGYRTASLGIVTPFRAQWNLIRQWVNQAYGSTARIKTGTAHQFQGDECDVMIFSPVLSQDILEGTLNWLQNTKNLLNVAITRARVSLVIVGDYEYCYEELKSKNVYNQLAHYIKDNLKGVYSSIEDLPVIGGELFEIIGTILDPSNPEHNRTNLLRFIRSCREFVDWLDPYFTQEIIDLFDDLYEAEPYPNIKSYRLLTAERQVKTSSGKLRPESVESLKIYLERFGVDFEMRVRPGEDLPHDRFLYHQGGAVNMPPFSGAYGSHRHVSEYTPSSTAREFFEEQWDKAISVIDVY